MDFLAILAAIVASPFFFLKFLWVIVYQAIEILNPNQKLPEVLDLDHQD